MKYSAEVLYWSLAAKLEHFAQVWLFALFQRQIASILIE
jgi:hypothetical protein